jgi:hypothetical protein
MAEIDPVNVAAWPAVPDPSLVMAEPSVFIPSKKPVPNPNFLTIESFWLRPIASLVDSRLVLKPEVLDAWVVSLSSTVIKSPTLISVA